MSLLNLNLSENKCRKTVFKSIFQNQTPSAKLSTDKKTKLSYKTTSNIKQTISSHNSKIIRKTEKTPEEKICNCRDKSRCPLQEKCLLNNLISQATITPTTTPQNPNPPTEKHTYIGLTSNSFKEIIGNHKKSINHRKYSKETILNRKIWALRDEGIESEITRKIIESAQPFSPISGMRAVHA